ncbi:hypothetical protein [bacterium endosymbiont of Bathymodiolus sp. 5 South]|uniref:hypothetical protein n=1 Tax=bacterium endosymbiont of Bathymodiolus sp. 5 South TaxID=1181670 RepID=UPI0010BA65C8|nr:hypothetical protein [bacterium endosymbiont of Bathymodiolus sp. 5 South]CAC9650005.1 hypothetical protein [uncultured Gammaproteobacteria bacterium]SHN93896.1 hypothetical protein BCLUESOX_1177 [bacterium endosymbiont of Bathymodiolus sp. 5 South]VVH58518.1 hypothetical protein BSPCLSOX_881 [uncultured Gammaproteobacteria bacterium]VVH61115.1 hypothetical protein BSPWISOX_2454 [uncultured Gammaproteobacteria bacterium]VVM25531.1 hypothetical protein BSPWISOXPB_10005 [uncultured Gammaprote
MDDKYFVLKNEYKYINFIKDCFVLNDNKCILSFYDNKIFDYDFFIDSIKNELNKKESYLLLHQLVNNIFINDQYLMIEDIELMEMMSVLFLKYSNLFAFHFIKYPAVLAWGYDQSFPFICKNSADLSIYKNIAKNQKLFLR